MACVRDAEPAAGAELPRLITQLVAQLHEQVEHDRHRLLVCTEGEDLRSDVGVQADQLEVGLSKGLLDGLASSSGLDREAELRVELTGGDVIVGVRLDARRDAQHDRRSLAIGHDPREHIELLEAVDDDGRAGAVGGVEVVPALVIAEEVEAVGWES